MYKIYFNDSVIKIIPAAGGLVKNAGSEYLFIFRNGKWDLPKGKLEKKESIKKCAVREVEEECGIHGVKIIRSLPPTFHIYELNGAMVLKHSHWFMMSYNGNENLTPQTEEGIEKVVWVKTKDIALLKKNMYPSIVDLLEKVLTPIPPV